MEEQFVLNRLAQAAIDTYTMSVVLSRASMSAKKNLPSTEHEITMTQTWCTEVENKQIIIKCSEFKANFSSIIQYLICCVYKILGSQPCRLQSESCQQWQAFRSFQ